MVMIAGAALLIASCSSDDAPQASATAVTSAALLQPVTTTSAVVDVTATTTVSGIAIDTTVAPTTAPTSVAATIAATTLPQPDPTIAPTTTSADPATVPPEEANVANGTPYGIPIEPGVNLGYAHEHHDYPASDVFAGGCGTTVVSPVNGALLEVRRENLWSADTDNPAARGGRSISLLGDDGVRYYFAHFEKIEDGIAPGDRVAIGDHLGQIGQTGRAGACHLHFALSPPCPGKEWSVRRGVIWPWPYLDAWQQGRQLSPADEIAQWSKDHPTACADAMADPNAADS